MDPSPFSEEPRRTAAPPPQDGSPDERGGSEPVWTFRGYRLRSSEFTTAMVHFFRAEVQRANVWRQRLDTTTNWAVVATGAVISFAFSTTTSSPIVIPLNLVLVTLFLFIEARRYRYYELWSYRVRLMETDFFAPMLVPPFHPSPDWAEAVSEHLLQPHFPISMWEAMGRRLRRNYLWIYLIVGLAWIAKLYLHPFPAPTFSDFIARARFGAITGEWVILVAASFFLGMTIFGIATVGLQEAAGEVLPRFSPLMPGGAFSGRGSETVRAWFRPTARRQQLLVFIVTDKAQAVTDRILKDMNRGVTAVAGTGMYTGKPHTVLMIALTVTEIPQLRHLVSSEDPKAFVIVSPAKEIFGGGFMPLDEEKRKKS